MALLQIDLLITFQEEDAIKLKVIDSSVLKVIKSNFEPLAAGEFLIYFWVKFLVFPLMILFSYFFMLGFEDVLVD